jgi:hypothetical protein
MALGADSHKLADPSMSVKRRVTVPVVSAMPKASHGGRPGRSGVTQRSRPTTLIEIQAELAGIVRGQGRP